MAKNPIAGCSNGNWNRIVRSNAEGVVSKSNNVICWEQWTVGLSGRGVYMKKYNNKYEIQFFRDLQMLIIKIFFLSLHSVYVTIEDGGWSGGCNNAKNEVICHIC